MSGSILCSDPNTKWAELVILKVNMDRVRKELQENMLITPSTIAPTPAMTTDNLSTKKRAKHWKKNVKKMSRRGRKQSRNIHD